MSIAPPIKPGEATVADKCAECGAGFRRRVNATRAKWCAKCALMRRRALSRRLYNAWYAKNGNPWRQRRREKEAAGVVATVAMSPDYVVPGVERIAEIEGRCGVCRLTYWTLDEAKRAASVCDRCAK